MRGKACNGDVEEFFSYIDKDKVATNLKKWVSHIWRSTEQRMGSCWHCNRSSFGWKHDASRSRASVEGIWGGYTAR